MAKSCQSGRDRVAGVGGRNVQGVDGYGEGREGDRGWIGGKCFVLL